MSARGYTLLESLVVLVLIGVLMGTAAFNLRKLENPADNGAAELVSFFKVTRAKALASTLAYTIKPASTTEIITTRGHTCEATQTADPVQTLTLPAGSHLDAVDWSVCYSPRGISNSSVDIRITDSDETNVVQVVLGGGVRRK